MQRLLLTALIACLLSAHSGASDDAEAVRALTALLAPLNSLSGKFSQRLVDSDGELLQSSQGDFAMQRNLGFRWHTQAPFEQLLVSDQKTLWFYDPDLEQVTVRQYDHRLAQTPALLLSGDVSQLQASFRVNQLTQDQAQGQVFRLVPIAPEQGSPAEPTQSFAKLFESVSLTFDARGALIAMGLEDSLQQRTDFNFQQLELNPTLSADMFRFQPPEGTDVFIDD